ncbi:MAG: ATP synthase F1 subunit epsilon [Proteiniphilum sp.]|jgi:F-type H+-transporting ATPase subunit epsilon|nr:ATP synthase F1 subunit epsilon [Proteiniphilum sp.]NCB24406.1 ATP synthase F1 subunit epsilon [Bacteroidia bacterium]MDD2937365.1 ATP synthase F1 subunit epsilon [Proteiniphilum sp.]MDD3075268.1 ATP synthase F1 subunit epsilon [Proteiniphilum sp.]MDD3778761.1 ATP synthase F1 subunit epsilon [Proteiniphilum sp.]
MQLEILTPEKTFYRGEVDSITLPGETGSFQILNNHAPLISSLKKGMLAFSVGKKESEMEITDGFVEVNHNKVTVLIDKIRNM